MHDISAIFLLLVFVAIGRSINRLARLRRAIAIRVPVEAGPAVLPVLINLLLSVFVQTWHIQTLLRNGVRDSSGRHHDEKQMELR